MYNQYNIELPVTPHHWCLFYKSDSGFFIFFLEIIKEKLFYPQVQMLNNIKNNNNKIYIHQWSVSSVQRKKNALTFWKAFFFQPCTHINYNFISYSDCLHSKFNEDFKPDSSKVKSQVCNKSSSGLPSCYYASF